MRRNTEGLKRSARLRSESAMHRALAALQRMDASDREINFRAVAAEAGVSTAWLYSQQGLRGRIMRSRKTTESVAPPHQPHRIESAPPGKTSWQRCGSGSRLLRRRIEN